MATNILEVITSGEESDESIPLTSPHKRRSTLRHYFNRLLQNKLFIGLTLGQVLSVIQSGSLVFSQLLQATPPGPFHAPNSQYFLVNLTLTLVFTTNLARQPQRFKKALLYRSILYLPVAILDAEAAYLILLSFQYTTLTSVNLLMSFVIVCAAVISVTFLSIKYTIQHLMGIAFALIGVVVLLLVDVNGGNPYGVLVGSSQKRMIGDGLVLLASLFYGITNVAAEVLSRRYGVAEYLGVHQLFAALIIGTQVCILEREALLRVDWNTGLVALLSVYILTTVLFVGLLNALIKLSGATAVNMSLITVNFYNLIFGRIIFNYKFSWLYLLGFSTLITGQILFFLRSTEKYESFGVSSWWRTWRKKRSQIF